MGTHHISRPKKGPPKWERTILPNAKRPSQTGEPDLQKLDEQEAYATTSIPIGRAVSLMLFTAASTEPAVRRGIVQQLV